MRGVFEEGGGGRKEDLTVKSNRPNLQGGEQSSNLSLKTNMKLTNKNIGKKLSAIQLRHIKLLFGGSANDIEFNNVY